MVIVFGTDAKLLGTFEAPDATCEISGTKGKTYSVYSKYFSLMFIPFIPLGKRVYSISTEGHEYEEDIDNPEVQQYINATDIKVKTPFYHYSGLILALLITLLVILTKYEVIDPMEILFSSGSSTEGGMFPNTVDHLEDPEVGDAYLMNFIEYKEPYSIYEIVELTDDSVYFNEAGQYFTAWDAAAMTIMAGDYTFPENPKKIAWSYDELLYFYDLTEETADRYIQGKGMISDVCRDEY